MSLFKKLTRAIRSIATRRNADTVEAIARAAGKGKVADAVQTVEDVVTLRGGEHDAR